MAKDVDWGEQANLLPEVYQELREQAKGYLSRERPDHTLQPTALVHDALLRLVKGHHLEGVDQDQLIGLAVRAMREVLVDYARSRNALKRGGGWVRVPLTESIALVDGPSIDLLALDEALARLSTLDPLMGQVIELRLFGGLTIKQTAEVLGISTKKVKWEWRVARTWLWHELGGGDDT